MKEVCERTGLTDRAVRLYIDNGLLSPSEEHSYTGRKSIQFSENDVAILEVIATLRKADFSISDIRNMQTSPERIHTIIDLHRKRLTGDIENKQRILQVLGEIKDTDSMEYTEIAEMIRRSASSNIVPKEDSIMRFKDFQQFIKHRILSVVAFALLVVEAVSFIPLIINAAFGDIDVLVGGRIDITYNFTNELFHRSILLFLVGAAIIAAAVVLFIHIIRGNRGLLLAGGGLCILAIVTLWLMPYEIRDNLFVWEFLNYRESFMWHILHAHSEVFDLFIKSLKYIPLIASAALACVGYFLQEDTSADNMQ